MCGIIGYSGAFSPEELSQGNALLCHRGPDDCGQFHDEAAKVGLAHRRLSILDLSAAGHQPMLDASRSVAVSLNGEIYNFRDLRAELEQSGHRFRSQSDTEVVLQLYLKHGPEMLPRLNGIFAVAIWDARQGTLLLARDALGVKPLYYASTSRGVAFASEIKGLLCLVPEARALDPESLHRYLTFLWCPGDGTPLRQVRKLGPGEAMLVKNGRVARRWVWYTLPAMRGVRANLSEAESIAATADGLRRAVHRQLVADVPVGAFLSGGLDSSAVVAFARERVPSIRCFTIENQGGIEAGMPDDLPFARRAAAHLGVPLDVVSVDASDMADDVVNLVTQLDEPLADPAPLNVLYISRLARRQGIKVLLSGAGGDDLFSGYRRHVALEYERYWKWLPQNVLDQLERSAARLNRTRAVSRRLAKLLSGASLQGNERLIRYFVWSADSQRNSLYSPELRAAIGDSRAEDPMMAFLAGIPESEPPLARLLALEQRFFLADHNLIYTDKMSMAAGVEARVPYLDLDLVELAARIPTRYKQRGRAGKWVLKKAMEPYLPREIIYRAKTGFGAPLRRWMRHELRPLVSDVLSRDRVKARGLFDPDAIQRLIAQNDRGEADAAYTVLSLLAIELWCSAYLDRRHAPVATPDAA
jgi:asparagine synthase (glutamine-hydrolysing)